MEGSSYTGFVVNDYVYFGDNYSAWKDGFKFVFGCIYKETNLFYTQKADGILGMGKGKGTFIKDEIPIWLAMYMQSKVKY